MLGNHLALIISWVLFAVIHHVMAAEAFKSRCQQLMGSKFRFYRLIFSIIAFITLFSVIYFQLSIDSPLLDIPKVIAFFPGLPMALAGLAIMHICIYKYFFRLSGVAVLAKVDCDPKLETDGVHRYVRHPLYLGTLMLIWALFLFFPLVSNLIASAAITVYVIIGIRSEEKKLCRLFGPIYRKYQRETPMLLPLA